LPPARAAVWPPLFERVLSQGPFRIELPFAGGLTREMAFNLIVVDGETTGISIFGKDITDRKRTELELIENADFLRQTQRIGGLGSYVLDLQTGVWACSDVLEELLGIGQDAEHTLEMWVSLIHPDDRAMVEAYVFDEVLAKKGIFDKEYRLNRATDKEERWLHGLGQVEFS
jgi:PAS domain-containing protein